MWDLTVVTKTFVTSIRHFCFHDILSSPNREIYVDGLVHLVSLAGAPGNPMESWKTQLRLDGKTVFASRVLPNFCHLFAKFLTVISLWLTKVCELLEIIRNQDPKVSKMYFVVPSAWKFCQLTITSFQMVFAKKHDLLANVLPWAYEYFLGLHNKAVAIWRKGVGVQNGS